MCTCAFIFGMSQKKSWKDSPELPQGQLYLEDREWAGRVEMVIVIVAINKRDKQELDRSVFIFIM